MGPTPTMIEETINAWGQVGADHYLEATSAARRLDCSAIAAQS